VSKSGLIWQCVSTDDSAYANGLSWNEALNCWVDPQGHKLRAPNPTPAWPELTPPINPNLTTISVECEGFYQDIPTDAQNAGVVKIMQWCALEFPQLAPYSFMRSLIGHCHISPVSKPNCPGPHVNYAALAAAANAAGPRIVRAGPYGAIARQDYQASGKAAAYYAPGTEIAIDTFHTNGYRHAASGVGFIADGDLIV
jgi:N-acetyl-anhydromuramyl-L-alanine amidase AmpD